MPLLHRPRPSSPSGAALHAQVRALPILLTTLALPGAGALYRFGSRPVASDTAVAGIPTTVVRPDGAPPWPTLVFVNGATPDGRSHPTVQRLGRALARAGVAVYIPDLDGVASGELSPTTLEQAVAVAETVAASPDTAAGRVGLAGVSIGATLALLAAADMRLRRCTSVVACVAPFGDLADVMRFATTHPGSPAYLRNGLARSLAAMLPATPETVDLQVKLRAIDPDSDRVALPKDAFLAAGRDAEKLYDLLANTDAARFDELHRALPVAVRRAVVSLSPVHVATRICAPVEIATAPRDPYFPLSQARALTAAAPHARLTVTSLLAHATPRLTPRYIAELRRLDAFFVRSLAAATA
ncbi:MAG TPA: alpha/beta fold hydrolase [Gaiellaceae bacterium]